MADKPTQEQIDERLQTKPQDNPFQPVREPAGAAKANEAANIDDKAAPVETKSESQATDSEAAIDPVTTAELDDDASDDPESSEEADEASAVEEDDLGTVADAGQTITTSVRDQPPSFTVEGDVTITGPAAGESDDAEAEYDDAPAPQDEHDGYADAGEGASQPSGPQFPVPNDLAGKISLPPINFSLPAGAPTSAAAPTTAPAPATGGAGGDFSVRPSFEQDGGVGGDADVSLYVPGQDEPVVASDDVYDPEYGLLAPPTSEDEDVPEEEDDADDFV